MFDDLDTDHLRPASLDGTGRLMPAMPPLGLGRWAPMFRLAALFFAAYPLIALLSTRPDALQVALVVVMDGSFLALIIVGGKFPADHPARTGWAIAGVVLVTSIACVLSLRDSHAGWIAAFYYASSAAIVVMPASVARLLMFVTGVAAAMTMFVEMPDLPSAFIQGFSVTIIGLILLTSTELRRANDQLQVARTELATRAVAEERHRIARDLHDILGHSLSVIALKSELARRVLPSDPDRAATEIADVERVARDALASVRETVSGYRQPSLAIEIAGARSVLAAAGIEGRVDPPPDDLPPIVDALLAWAVREGVTNVVRHSGAERAEIRVERSGDEAAVEVVDDGAGRDDGGRPHVTSGAAGSGLAGLRERVAGLGGRVEAAPLPGRGFKLVVTVPLEPS